MLTWCSAMALMGIMMLLVDLVMMGEGVVFIAW
jgi:hypothetical protein